MLAKKKLLGEFRIGRTIGEGAFSKVKLAHHRVTNEKVAIKIIKKDDGKEKKDKKESLEPAPVVKDPLSPLAQLSKEVKLLMRLNHPNVIGLHQVIDTADELYIVMDYASGGELIDYIAAKRFLTEKEARRLFRQLVSALDHCHLAGVIHRDLKLENMLLSSERNLLLSDFGLGRTINGGSHYLNTFCGTPLYAAPELVSGINYIGPSADIWSTGIVLFIMTSGKPPFRCETIAELYAQIKAVKYKCPDTFTEPLKALLAKILVKDPRKRASMDVVRNDEWMNLEESEVVPRIAPKISLNVSSDLQDQEIESLVTHMEKQDDFCAFYFKKPVFPQDEDATLARKPAGTETLGRRSAPQSATSSGSTNMQGSNSLSSNGTIPRPAFESLGPGEDRSVSFPRGPAVIAKSKTMQASTSATVSRFNPFTSNSKTPAPVIVGKPDDEPESRRQRSASVAPTSSAYDDAARASSGATGGSTVGRDIKQAKPSNIPVTLTIPSPAQPSHVRRHSMAVGAPIPGAQPNATLKDDRSHDSVTSPTTSQSISPGGSLMVPSIVNAKSGGPSMELISEHEEAVFQGPGQKPKIQPPARAKTTSPEDNHRRRPSIIESMGFHTHSGYSDEIRTVRFATNLHTSSAYGPSEICAQLDLFLFNKRLMPNMTVEKRSKYVWVIEEESELDEKLIMEVEIVKVWLLKMNAVKMKRLGGDALAFKDTYEKVVQLLNW